MVRATWILRVLRQLPYWAALTSAGVVLIRLRPSLSELRQLVSDAGWVDRVGLDGAVLPVCRLLVWVAALWLMLGLLAIGLSAAPGSAGRTAQAITLRLLPAAARQLLTGALGFSVMLTPGQALAVSGDATPPRTATPGWSVAISATASPAWTGPGAEPPGAQQPSQLSPTWLADARQDVATDSVPAASVPSVDIPADTVVVAPGDSLWLLAAHRLPASAPSELVQQASCDWYATNRATIGDDPNLIHPGQTLLAPPLKD
jgi:resuscitation-promoting factor RpfA